jgi:hypothetical protein
VIVEVVPVFAPSVRGLCARAYPGHRHGCPNFGKRFTCPPAALLLFDLFEESGPFYAIVNRFNLGAHVERMASKHPGWSARQLVCCLYWQAGARRELEREIQQFRAKYITGFGVTRCPEAMGLNVTATLKNAGIEIEWPPKHFALQVALAGRHKKED